AYLHKSPPPPQMRNVPFRNDLFVLQPDDRTKVVQERFGPIKDEKRARTKISSGRPLLDINRVTLEFEDPKILELAFECIKTTPDFQIVCVKNKFNEVDQPPCIHLNVAVKSGQGYDHDWICEIQMYLRSILRIKTTSHVFYNVARANSEFEIKDLNEKAPSEQQPPPPAAPPASTAALAQRKGRAGPPGRSAPPPGGAPPPPPLPEAPPSEETKVLEGKLAEAKSVRDLPLMKSAKAELAVSRKTDSLILAASTEVEGLKKQLEDAWANDNEELIEQVQELLNQAEEELATAEKPRHIFS
ncbi:hypothetical protein TrST_g6367, partial [Triparma strigata]